MGYHEVRMNRTKKLELNTETLRNLSFNDAAGVVGGDTGTTAINRPVLTITICDGATCSDFISLRKDVC